jgi:hypothetical protein
MADAKTRLIIGYNGGSRPSATGWTETFYTLDDSLQIAVQSCVDTYLPKRRALLGVGATVSFVRATSIPTTRLSYIQFLTGKDAEGNLFTTSPEDDFDPSQVDLLVRMQTANAHRRQFWLAGLPDKETDTLKVTGVNGAFTNSPAYKQWIATINALGYRIRYKVPPGPNTFDSEIISQTFPIMIRNRKRGRPFFPFHGRRAV